MFPLLSVFVTDTPRLDPIPLVIAFPQTKVPALVYLAKKTPNPFDAFDRLKTDEEGSISVTADS